MLTPDSYKKKEKVNAKAQTAVRGGQIREWRKEDYPPVLSRVPRQSQSYPVAKQRKAARKHLRYSGGVRKPHYPKSKTVVPVVLWRLGFQVRCWVQVARWGCGQLVGWALNDDWQHLYIQSPDYGLRLIALERCSPIAELGMNYPEFRQWQIDNKQIKKPIWVNVKAG